MEDLEALTIAVILLGLVVVMGMPVPGTKLQAIQSSDYHQIARQDAINVGIDPNLFEKQINQESGFNPSAVSSVGAIGIAQIMPTTASGWNVDPHNPVASLQAAANAMATYLHTYGSYDKALACYNAGCSALDTAIARCGLSWRVCVPAETQRYITAIMGV